MRRSAAMRRILPVKAGEEPESMTGRELIADASAFCHATLSNQLARFMPGVYVRLTRQTGRGAAPETPREIAEYFTRCFDDYFACLNVQPASIPQFLEGKRILEYGPGDVLGTALLMYAHGASEVHCLDRFPLQRASAQNHAALGCLLDSLRGQARSRAESTFLKVGDPASGFDPQKISYLLRPSGLSGGEAVYDLSISRAVLEHVDDLDGTFRDIRRSLRPGGLSIHLVDLKSHGLDRRDPLDFLTWPHPVYRLMFSHKGFPNRWRVDRYRALTAAHGLACRSMHPTDRLTQAQVETIRARLAQPFRALSSEDLSWLSFWMVLEKPAEIAGGPNAGRPEIGGVVLSEEGTVP